MDDDAPPPDSSDTPAGKTGSPPGKRGVPPLYWLLGGLVLLVMVLLAALIGAAVDDPPTTTASGGSVGPSGAAPDQVRSSGPSSGPGSTPPTPTTPTSAPPITSAPARLTPLKKGEATVTCRLSPAPRPGRKVTLTYVIDADRAGTVGLGSGIYDTDGDGTDLGTNDEGDKNSYALRPGSQTVSRPLYLPRNLPAGRYEITGELWPTGRVGDDHVETVADNPCDHMTVS